MDAFCRLFFMASLRFNTLFPLDHFDSVSSALPEQLAGLNRIDPGVYGLQPAVLGIDNQQILGAQILASGHVSAIADNRDKVAAAWMRDRLDHQDLRNAGVE